MRPSRVRSLIAAALAVAAAAWWSAASAQNVVDDNPETRRIGRVTLGPADVEALVAETPDFAATAKGAEAERVRAKLGRHVAEFVAGFPWKAFHNTLGISGYEAYFNHPDEMFHCLAIALPQLKAEVATATRKLLAAQLGENPPFAVQGFQNTDGRPRERYGVPEEVRIKRRGKANGALGVYAFWAWCHWAGDSDAAKIYWAAVKERMTPVLESQYRFDITRRDYAGDEAERLNADLAGLVGLVRLAKMNGDRRTEAKAKARAVELLTLRVNLERVNPNILERTRSASKTLHIAKLARYCRLVPEVGRAVRALSDGTGPMRLEAFREKRNAWYLAFTERLIGGENYVSPPHMGRALMAGATFIEELPGEELLTFVDIPWCKGDFYFIEKCAYGLWAAAGNKWKAID